MKVVYLTVTKEIIEEKVQQSSSDMYPHHFVYGKLLPDADI